MTPRAYEDASKINRIEDVYAIQDTIAYNTCCFFHLDDYLLLFDVFEFGHRLRTLDTDGIIGMLVHCYLERPING